jgi:hypothetical protein
VVTFDVRAADISHDPIDRGGPLSGSKIETPHLSQAFGCPPLRQVQAIPADNYY